MTWTEIAELPLALLNCDMRARQFIDEAFTRGRSAPDPRVETDSVAALFAYVTTGEWASVVPQSWLRSIPMPAGTSVVEIVDPHAIELISIASRSGDESTVGADFIGLVMDREFSRTATQNSN
jgi:DNA-binding transcriptional LysR family regulator